MMSNAGIALVSNGYLLVKRFKSFTRPIKFQCFNSLLQEE
jgi:hypothetical protein